MSRELAELTWEQVRDLPRDRTVALLPVGSVEAHGPHLPLGTDTLIAQAAAQAAATRLQGHGIAALLLPAMPYAAAPFAASFTGTISVSPSAYAALIADIAAEVHRHGFAALVLVNAHLDPAHLEALRSAAALADDRGAGPVVFPDLTRRALAARLSDEFRSGSCHAGSFEGSVVMALRPELVHDEVRQALPPVTASLVTAIRAGARTFEEAGGPRAYFGRPAEATAEEGRATVQTLGELVADAVRAALAARGAA
jgi:creatinine amidohydrolase